jgi:hypothetical protein
MWNVLGRRRGVACYAPTFFHLGMGLASLGAVTTIVGLP